MLHMSDNLLTAEIARRSKECECKIVALGFNEQGRPVAGIEQVAPDALVFTAMTGIPQLPFTLHLN